ncbi:alkylglycerol monooxygenase isoform X1 [Nomia melanderi]|uniref:alkylglycerol monooxygenase isoform X1 n=1 Tax=Nomia melanderi TaxID=2448451 RepID=UPI00130462F9|nr:alkylglycerol monooxygenase-like isoform X1 [Nomia melanderi]XP_031833248.1 alkylglycerol monooxygenase-like isoform X1 [Nomia melanderi]XP_031833250.1 alkylglycerol monooxygenase-like isoform X1 [Nomia melanderi]XP_031833251.1 alkylglycerol monooxygenase-like isoform X1 [Nomia melanderi]XP_031833252.1 alkylglycerol monooxygenase-like isoform X1 [Nomia melanderi]
MNVSCAAPIFRHFKNAGKLFYLVNPYETTFEFPQQVPDYHQQVWLPFFVLIILEQIVLISKKKKFRLNDQVTSLSHWLLHESGRIFFRSAEYYLYIVIYERYRFWSLPWSSAWTWCITAVGVDFCYYWVHRSNHEVHFLWAHHQVHHSSEEFTLAVGLRQSILQHWCNFVFYLPLAFFLPPSHFIVHNQFNLIYQLWIHTTLIDDLGPFELIFNTPKHHRVHHGCNLYCLDKNYGGVLIIWDKLFGTFMEEKEKDEIIYGLVVSPQSFNPLYLQVFYTVQLVQKSLRMQSLTDKLAVFWKGPSWFPGGPRLGLDEYKINVTSRVKYDTTVPNWQNLYTIVHFCLILYGHFQLYKTEDAKTLCSGFTIVNDLLVLTTIGLIFDKSKYAGVIELTRCLVYLSYSTVYNSINVYIYCAHVASCCVWISYLLCQTKSNAAAAKTD